MSTMDKKSGRFATLAEQRRDQILTAAAECFRKSGFHSSTIAQISKQAGMSPGHIYHFFENKEAIIAGIVERDVNEVLDFFGGFEERGGNIIDTMMSCLDQGFDKKMNLTKTALQLEVVAEAARNPCVAAILQEADVRIREKLFALLYKLMGDRLTEAEVMAKADMLGTVFDGLMMRGVRHPALDRAAVLREMRNVVQTILRY